MPVNPWAEHGWATEPGTIDDLLDDAGLIGFPANQRLIHEWVQLGLLDHPERRTRGESGGSDKAIWPRNQRSLFRLLISKRHEVRTIPPLCQLVVAMWLWFGEGYVPVRQARRAFETWAAKTTRVSWTTAKRQAREILAQFETPGASREARERLVDVVALGAFNGSVDPDALMEAVTLVYDPRGRGSNLDRLQSPEDFVHVVAARCRGLQRVRAGVSDQELRDARNIYDAGRAGWDQMRPFLQQAVHDPRDASLVADESVQDKFDHACPTLLMILGMGTNGGDAVGPTPPKAAEASKRQAAKNAAAHRKPKKPSKRHR
jgi:hypothetical protein